MGVDNLEQFLDEFRSDDLAYALKSLDLPISGSKPNRVLKIMSHYSEQEDVSIKDILNSFRKEDVKRAAENSRILDI
jgi:hypothetical protein